MEVKIQLNRYHHVMSDSTNSHDHKQKYGDGGLWLPQICIGLLNILMF